MNQKRHHNNVPHASRPGIVPRPIQTNRDLQKPKRTNVKHPVDLMIPYPPKAANSKVYKSPYQIEHNPRYPDSDSISTSSRGSSRTNGSTSRRPIMITNGSTHLPNLQANPRGGRKKSNTTQLSSEALARIAAANSPSITQSQSMKEYSFMQKAHSEQDLSKTSRFNHPSSPSRPPLRSRKSNSKFDLSWDQEFSKQSKKSANYLGNKNQLPQTDVFQERHISSSCPHNNSILTDALLDDRSFL
ncbi:hypothetical protein BDF19DRAFT_415475 [Syncephalis fuscata]|nr:hypothetical protein BDF19DRAFT_415475 [Syncephalis fuscata]